MPLACGVFDCSEPPSGRTPSIRSGFGVSPFASVPASVFMAVSPFAFASVPRHLGVLHKRARVLFV